MAGTYNVIAIGNDTEFSALVAAATARYAGCGRLVAGYVAGKLRRDPVTRAVLAEAASGGLGEVVDLGCGRGQLGIALLLAGAARSVRGLEVAPRALAQAAQAAAGLAFRAEARDLVRDASVPAADTVLVVDVLYQLPDAAQAAVLAAAARAARRRVLIRMLDPDRGARSALTVGLEQLGRRLSPHSGAMVNPRPVAEAASALRAAGFAVAVTPCWAGTPFANVLLIARRSPPPPC